MHTHLKFIAVMRFLRVFFLLQDYDRLVDHYMLRGSYAEALFVFTTHPSCAAKLYQYSAQLAPYEPKMLVDAWVRAGRRLIPCRQVYYFLGHLVP